MNAKVFKNSDHPSHSEVATNIARYFASDDDLETVLCFLDRQLTGELPRSKRYPVTDLRVLRQATQSESEKA